MPLLSVDNVAETLNCSIEQVYVLIANRQLPFVNIGSGTRRRCIRFTEEAIDDFIRSRQTEAAIPTPMRPPAKPNRDADSRLSPRRDWV